MSRFMGHSDGRIRRLAGALALVVVLGVATPATAEAGLLDSITGFFGKAADTVKGWFSGGGEKDFVKLLEQTVQAQEQLSEKQTNLQAYLNEKGKDGVKPNDPVVNERLNDIAQTARQNEALYLSLLKARDELQKSKKDISKYQEALAKITERQNAIEEQSQEIQKFARGTGAFTPPAKIAGAGAGKSSIVGGTGSGAEVDWRNPEAQKYIDEWLRLAGLTEWGVYLAPGARAAGPPSHGSKQRHEWVWENMWTKDAGTNISLGDFVRQRLSGQNPAVTILAKRAPTFAGGTASLSTGSNPGKIKYGVSPFNNGRASSTGTASVPSAGPVKASQTGAAAQVDASGSGAGTSALSGELRDLVDQEKTILSSISKLNTEGQGNSEQSRALYENLKVVQDRKNALIRSQSGGGTGAITDPR